MSAPECMIARLIDLKSLTMEIFHYNTAIRVACFCVSRQHALKAIRYSRSCFTHNPALTMPLSCYKISVKHGCWSVVMRPGLDEERPLKRSLMPGECSDTLQDEEIEEGRELAESKDRMSG